MPDPDLLAFLAGCLLGFCGFVLMIWVALPLLVGM